MWGVPPRKGKYMEAITRYVISECNCVIDKDTQMEWNYGEHLEDYLYEGVVREIAEPFLVQIKGVYKTEENAKQALSKYKTVIRKAMFGEESYHVTEYYLYSRTYNLSKAIEECNEINSELDFDKQLMTDYFGTDAHKYLIKNSEWCMDESPMHFVVEVYDETKREEKQKYVRFYSYNEASDFICEILNLINEGYLETSLHTHIWFNKHDTETITAWDFMNCLDEQNIELKKKQVVKCRL